MRAVGNTNEVDLEVLRQVSYEVKKPQEAVVKVQKPEDADKKAVVSDSVRMTNEELQKIIQEIKKKLDLLNRYLKIEIDDQLDIPVVKVFERDTNRLIRQVPPDHVLRIMRRIDQLLGVFLSERV